jgi:predicted ATPase/DNA-binding CsgD family transcriptional regulator
MPAIEVDPIHTPMTLTVAAAAGREGENPTCTPTCGAGCLMRSPSCNPIPIVPMPRVGDTPAHNLTAQPTQLVGRADDITRGCHQLLLDKVRLLTLIGPAGVGKTRLALAIGDCTLDTFTDGVFFVDLVPTEDPVRVLDVIANTLGVTEAREQPLLQRLADCLTDQSVLVILDNFEHLLPAAADVARLLSVCPSIKVVATSRAALRLRWEYLLHVKPLPVPPAASTDLNVIAESAAVRLFVQRAKAADLRFELTAENAAHVGEVCRRLDGLPLALELAAARVRVLPPQALLAQLGRRFDLLASGAHDVPARQRTLRKALDYGFDLLEKDEQNLLMRISLFAGGCTAEGATVVDSGDASIGSNGFKTLQRLDSLVDKSLIHQELTSDGQARFYMLETVREYAHEQLVRSGELDIARQRWLEYLLAFVDQAAKALLGPSQAEWLTLIDREHSNLRAALRACLDTGDVERGVQFALSLWRFWYVHGLFAEGRDWFDELLRQPALNARTLTRASALNAAGKLAFNQGDESAAQASLRESLSIYRELDNTAGAADSLETLGHLEGRNGAASVGREMLQESLALRRELGDAWGVAASLRCLGDLEAEEGHRSVARARYEESLLQWQTLGDQFGVALVLESMAVLAEAHGKPTRALHLAGAATALRDRLRVSCCSPAERARVQRCLESAQRRLGQDAAAQIVDEGRAMNVGAAITYARSIDERTPLAAAHVSRHASFTGSEQSPELVDSHIAGLTNREREVVALVLRGASNRRIAEELVITERTAETHVCRILGKLGLSSRAQIAALLVDHNVSGQAP